MEFKHVSIMPDECMKLLDLKEGGVYVDGTLGGAGHSSLILKETKGTLIGIDKDTEALSVAKERLDKLEGQAITLHGDFFNMKNLIPKEYVGKINGILLDLGVSSYQLDNEERGFSFMHDGELDMRMDKQQSFSAKTVVNEYSENELTEIFYKYGEENWSKRIAKFICEKRKSAPINTTFELVDIIKSAVPKNARQKGLHPATRVFQAIRIEVNGELSGLEKAITDMTELLCDKGRIAVITFHSLEDRIIKQTFKALEDPCVCSKKLPVCVCGKVSMGKVLTKKPIIPKEEEIKENPRSRSAKLRGFVKCSN